MSLEQTLLKIIHILSDGCFHSGETIAKELDVTRSAVNQIIHKMNLWGLTVFSVKGKGYKLSQRLSLYQLDKFNEQNIPIIIDNEQKKRVKELFIQRSSLLSLPSHSKYELTYDLPYVFLFPIHESTNQFLLDSVGSLINGDVCIAEYQYAARGRRGRRYYAPFGSNLYFSFYWQCSLKTEMINYLSLVIGILTVQVLEEMGVKGVKLKWPNDLYLENKKLGGILIESKIHADEIHFVIGIGLNLTMNEVDPHIVTQDWISLIQQNYWIDKNDLVITMRNKMIRLFDPLNNTNSVEYLLDKWRQYDIYKINTPVSLLKNGELIEGYYHGIDNKGHLLFRKKDDSGMRDGSQIQAVAVGEVSLRKSGNPSE